MVLNFASKFFVSVLLYSLMWLFYRIICIWFFTFVALFTESNKTWNWCLWEWHNRKILKWKCNILILNTWPIMDITPVFELTEGRGIPPSGGVCPTLQNTLFHPWGYNFPPLLKVRIHRGSFRIKSTIKNILIFLHNYLNCDYCHSEF